ncbi:MAG: hypothetical protein JO048_13205, partial [Methylobacteriaceae bacterium]|nr:hypothetical protein [Methylobacteriaceae bacterium]
MRSLRLPVALAAALLVPALPAAAQPYGYGYYNAPPPLAGFEPGYARPLPPREIRDRLEDDGYELVGPLRLVGATYEVVARDEDDRRVRLVVDAFRGRILDRRLAYAPEGPPEAARPGRFGPPEEMPEAELRRRGELRPP